MTLIITAVAAIIVTIIRFAKPSLATRLHLGALALMYWGASLMWSVDGIASLVEGEAFVQLQDSAAMADDALLGASVVVLGVLAWLVVVFVNRTIKRSSGVAA